MEASCKHAARDVLLWVSGSQSERYRKHQSGKATRWVAVRQPVRSVVECRVGEAWMRYVQRAKICPGA